VGSAPLKPQMFAQRRANPTHQEGSLE
jgi:hypothetical protein